MGDIKKLFKNLRTLSSQALSICLNNPKVTIPTIGDTEMFQVYLWVCTTERKYRWCTTEIIFFVCNTLSNLKISLGKNSLNNSFFCMGN